MKAKPTGMLWMMPAGWLNHLRGAAGRALKALPESHLTDRTNKFTLLDDAVWGFGGPRKAAGLARLADSGSSLGYVTLPAFAAACLA